MSFGLALLAAKLLAELKPEHGGIMSTFRLLCALRCIGKLADVSWGRGDAVVGHALFTVPARILLKHSG